MVQRWRHRRRLRSDPTRLTLDTPEALEALDKFLALRTDGLIPTRRGVGRRGRRGSLRQRPPGDVPRARGGSTPQFRLITDFEWDVAPLPVLARAGRRAALRRLLHAQGLRRTTTPRSRSSSTRSAPRVRRSSPGPAAPCRRCGRSPSPTPSSTPTLPPASSAVFLDTIPAIRAAADDLDVAGDRGRDRRDPRGRPRRRHAGRRGRPATRRGHPRPVRPGRVTPMAGLTFDAVGKRYGAVTALAALDLDVGDGEAVCVLGPSGSGKSTALRLAAGLERVSAGRVLIDGVDVTGRPAAQRDVVDGVPELRPVPPSRRRREHRLRARRAQGPQGGDPPARRRRRRRSSAAASCSHRRPAQLSGGERQRVAARPGAGAPAGDPAARRAALQPRPAAARRHARRAAPAPRLGRHDDGPRHPRPVRGADDRRPRRRRARRPARADGVARRRLPPPGQPLRRHVRRPAADERAARRRATASRIDAGPFRLPGRPRSRRPARRRHPARAPPARRPRRRRRPTSSSSRRAATSSIAHLRRRRAIGSSPASRADVGVRAGDRIVVGAPADRWFLFDAGSGRTVRFAS